MEGTRVVQQTIAQHKPQCQRGGTFRISALKVRNTSSNEKRFNSKVLSDSCGPEILVRCAGRQTPKEETLVCGHLVQQHPVIYYGHNRAFAFKAVQMNMFGHGFKSQLSKNVPKKRYHTYKTFI